MSTPGASHTIDGITVLERGWLSSNNVLLHAGNGDAGAVLVDTGHGVHAAQTLALVERALAGRKLARIVNTHLHSDHCGGNAALQREHACRVTTPASSFAAARDWNPSALTYAATGQLCERFVADDALAPGDSVVVGRRRWQAVAAPGHDPDSLLLFDAEGRVLLSADALWEDGFGVVFPELDGGHGYDDVARVLDHIEALRPRWVIPGHGAPFADAAAAVDRARSRLAGFRAAPDRHALHAARVLVKYHLMERRRETEGDFAAWFESTSLCRVVWSRLGRPGQTPAAFGWSLVDALVDRGALVRSDGWLADG